MITILYISSGPDPQNAFDIRLTFWLPLKPVDSVQQSMSFKIKFLAIFVMIIKRRLLTNNALLWFTIGWRCRQSRAGSDYRSHDNPPFILYCTMPWHARPNQFKCWKYKRQQRHFFLPSIQNGRSFNGQDKYVAKRSIFDASNRLNKNMTKPIRNAIETKSQRFINRKHILTPKKFKTGSNLGFADRKKKQNHFWDTIKVPSVIQLSLGFSEASPREEVSEAETTLWLTLWSRITGSAFAPFATLFTRLSSRCVCVNLLPAVAFHFFRMGPSHFFLCAPSI